MARSFDRLIDFLLKEIALSGDLGATVSDVFTYVEKFYRLKQQDSASSFTNLARQTISSIQLQNPTTQKEEQAAFDRADRPLKEKIWKWLTSHPDIRVGKDRQGNSLSLIQAENASANLKIYANEERIWLVLAGHEPDPTRIPPFEFQILSVIASHGVDGVLQPDIVRLTGQDKRSVPRRTDALRDKGYIEKKPALAYGTRTSICTLLRFLKISDSQEDHTHRETTDEAFLSYIQPGGIDELVRNMFQILAETHLLTLIDLKRKMGLPIRKKNVPTKSLAKVLQRYERLGCLKRIWAISASDDVEDRVFRSVKFIREPRGEEWRAHVDTVMRSLSNMKDEDLEDGDYEDIGNTDQVGDEIPPPSGLVSQGLREVGRIAPQWQPGMSLETLLFKVIDATGPSGISTMELKLQAMGPFFHKPIEVHINRLVHNWSISQPSHLRHLAVLRDTAQSGRNTFYVHYSYRNFQLLVANHEREWEAVILDENLNEKTGLDAVLGIPNVDEYGFPNIPSNQFVGQSKTATLAESAGATKAAKLQITSFDPVAVQRNDGTWGIDWGNSHHKGEHDQELRERRQMKPHTHIRRPMGRPRKYPKGFEPYSKEGKKRLKELKLAKQKELKARRDAEKVASGGKSGKKRQADEVDNAEISPSKRPAPRATRRNAGLRQVAGLDEDSLVHNSQLKNMDTVTSMSNDEPISTPNMLSSSEKALQDNAATTQALTNSLPVEQINQTKPKLMSNSMSKVLINPPGSNKPNKGRGRPRAAKVAVFKLPSLLELDWFRDNATEQLSSKKVRKMPTPQHAGNIEHATSKSYAPVTPSKTGKRKLSVVEDLRSTPDPDSSRPKKKPLRETRLFSPTTSTQNEGNELSIRNIQEEAIAIASSRSDDQLSHGTPPEMRPDDRATLSDQDAIISGEEKSPSDAVSRLIEDISSAGASIARNVQDNISPGPPVEDLKNQTFPSRLSNHSKINLETDSETQALDSFPPNIASGSDTNHETDPGNSDAPAEPVQEHADAGADIPAASNRLDGPYLPNLESSPFSSPSKGKQSIRSVMSLGGTIGLQRRRVLMDIIEKCHGVFPGDRQLYFAFTTAWARYRQDGTLPDYRTMSKILNSLIDTGKVRQLKFSFKNKKGVMVTKSIVTKTDIATTSEVVRQLQRNMISADPFHYIPPEVEVSDEFMRRVGRLENENGLRSLDENTEKVQLIHDHSGSGRRVGRKREATEPGRRRRGGRRRKGPDRDEMAPLLNDQQRQEARERIKKAVESTSRFRPSTFRPLSTMQSRVSRLYSTHPTALGQKQPPPNSEITDPARSRAPYDGRLPKSLEEIGIRSLFPQPSHTSGLGEAPADYGSLVQVDHVKSTIAHPPGYASQNLENQRRSSSSTLSSNLDDVSNPAPPSLYESYDHDSPPYDGTVMEANQIFHSPSGTFGTNSLIPTTHLSPSRQALSHRQSIDLWPLPNVPPTRGDLFPRDLEDILSQRIFRGRGPKDHAKQADPQWSEFESIVSAVERWEIRNAALFETSIGEWRYINHVPPCSPSVGIEEIFFSDMHTFVLHNPLIPGLLDHPVFQDEQLLERPSMWGILYNHPTVQQQRPFPTPVLPGRPQFQGSHNWSSSMAYLDTPPSTSNDNVRPVLWHTLTPETYTGGHGSINYYEPAFTSRQESSNRFNGDMVISKTTMSTPDAGQTTRSRDASGRESDNSAEVTVVASRPIRTKPSETLKRRRLTRILADDLSRSTEVPLVKDADDSIVPRKRRLARGSRASKRLPPDVAQRFMLAVVAIRTLAGGVEKNIDWALLSNLFEAYDIKDLQYRWSRIRTKHQLHLEKVGREFQELFLKAYEQGTIPAIDYDHLEAYDWQSLIEWAVENVGMPFQSENSMPLLGGTREDLQRNYHFREDSDAIASHIQDYFEPNLTGTKRATSTALVCFMAPINERTVELSSAPLLETAKTWIRANVVTQEEDYDATAAREKLASLGESIINDALRELLSAKVLADINKGRTAPGRNYDITEQFVSALKGSLEEAHFRRAAAYKLRLDHHFKNESHAVFPYHAEDGDVIALTNLLANRAVTVRPRNPPLNRFGLTDGDYNTRFMDRNKLFFELEIQPTDSYVYGNPLQPLPPLPRPADGDARIPLWIDIHGNFVAVLWNMVLAAAVGGVALRPGITIAGIVQMMHQTLGEWEVAIIMQWAEIAGVVKKVVEKSDPDNGKGKARMEGSANPKYKAAGWVGWTVNDYWWLLFWPADGPSSTF